MTRHRGDFRGKLVAVVGGRLNGGMSDATLAALASDQGALVTHYQALQHLSRRQLDGRLATGRLIVVRRGVYRFAGAPEPPWQDLRAALLAAGPAAVASFRSAAQTR